MTIRTPAGSKGSADVVVTNPDGAAGQLDGGFTYADSDAAKLDLLSLKPAKAKSDGGSVILVDGKGMQTGAMIFVDWEPREGLDVQDAPAESTK